jgi:DNA-binding response OmpR family regulator
MTQPRILVVDDDEDSRLLVERMLNRHEFEVLTAEDGKAAVRIAQSAPPDLIVLDIMMPGMDGLEVYARLKESDKTRHIPIIMLTALNQADQVARALDIAPNWYITKPFEAKYLLKRVRQVLFNSLHPRPLTE